MPKLIPALTVAQIEKAAAGVTTRGVDLRDGAQPGLRLYLGPTRSTWSLYASAGGRRVVFPLGAYPEMSLAKARQAAQERRGALSSAMPISGAANAPQTLCELIERYGEHRGASLRTWEEMQATFRRVFVGLMSRKLLPMPASALQKALDEYPTRKGAGAALKYLRPILKWARKRGYIAFDPTALDAPSAYTPRDRVLSDDELRAVFAALGRSHHDTVIRLLLLTGCRLSEVTGMRWDELSETCDRWTVPRERTKSKIIHTVPLPAAAIKLLPARKRGDVYVLAPPDRNWNWDRYQKALFAKSGTSGWCRHDLRRTAATILARIGYEPHIIEVILGHKNIYSRLAATYNHHRYEEKHREALEQLASFYASLM